MKEEKRKVRILIIDDSQDDRYMLRRFFTKTDDYEADCVEVENGTEGLALLQGNQEWDCVFLDYLLPDTTGIELLGQIYKEGRFELTPIVIITGQGSESVAVEAMKLGAFDYLTKNNISEPALTRVINNAISMRKQFLQVRKEKVRREEAEGSLESLDVLLKSSVTIMPLGYILWDKGLRVIEWNPAAESTFGYKRAEVIGKQAEKVWIATEIGETLGKVGTWSGKGAGVSETVTLVNTHKDGSKITCLWYITPILDGQGEVTGILSMVRDITVSMQLQKVMEDNSDELSSLNEELNSTNEELTASNEELEVQYEELTATNSELVDSQEALQASEERHKYLYQNTPAMLHSIDDKGILVSISNEWARQMGYQPDEVLGRPSTDFLTEESKKFAREVVIPEFLKKGECHNVTYQFVKKGGEIINVSLSAIAEKDNDGRIVRSLAIVTDITEQRNAEEFLKESEDRFMDVFYSTSDALLLIDGDEFIECNDSVVAMLGYENRAKILNSHPSKLSPPKQPDGRKSFEKAGEMIQLAMENGFHRFEWEHRKANGTDFPVEVTLILIIHKGKRILQCLWKDLTDKKHADQMIKQAEDDRQTHVRFLEVLDRVDFAIREGRNMGQMLADTITVVQEEFGSDRAWLLYPLDPSSKTFQVPIEIARPEWPGANLQGKGIPVSAEAVYLMKHCLNNSLPSVFNENSICPIPADSAENFSVQSILAMPLFVKHGKPWLFGLHQCSYSREWTSVESELFHEIGRRLSDGLSGMLFLNDLQESEERHRTLIKYAPEAIVVLDLASNRFIETNENAERLFGLSHEELLEVNPVDLSPSKQPDGRLSGAVSQGKIHKAMDGEPQCFEWTYVNKITKREVLCEVRLVSLPSSTRELIRGSMLDIADRKQAEEKRLNLERQVLQAQKLESLGIMAGGIAHDFNNLLMVIMGNADLALDGLSPHAPARENINEIENAAKRAAGLAKQMLAYSGKGKFEIESISLNEFVGEMSHLLEVSISKKTVMKYNYVDNLPCFKGDATQIRQVIMNLIINASEAVGDTSGVISLSTGTMDCTDDYLESTNHAMRTGIDESLKPGCYVYFEVSDTGCGMDPDTLSKIFDPFFTTKFTGRGLGLAAVQGILRGHGGAMKLYSEVGKGTNFKVLFPVYEEEMKSIPATQGLVEVTWSKPYTILIADDEKSILAVGKSMLTRLGFTVLTAKDGKEAVEVYLENKNTIDGVLLDLTMPHKDGHEVFRDLRAINSDVKVLLCSGFSEQEATQAFVGKGLAGFIHKPYTTRDLLEKLQVVLEG